MSLQCGISPTVVKSSHSGRRCFLVSQIIECGIQFTNVPYTAAVKSQWFGHSSVRHKFKEL